MYASITLYYHRFFGSRVVLCLQSSCIPAVLEPARPNPAACMTRSQMPMLLPQQADLAAYAVDTLTSIMSHWDLTLMSLLLHQSDCCVSKRAGEPS